jgi:hypothetical protein
MSGQSGKENVSYDSGQQTPVIIKTGGNRPVTIDARYNPFNELVSGRTWVMSQSASKRRITKLLIEEATKSTLYERTSPELASIRIEYDKAQMVVLEAGNPDTNEIYQVIVSVGIPFTVETPGTWEVATAKLPPITRVTFMAGTEEIVSQKFTDDPVVNLHIMR